MKNPCERKCWNCKNVAMHADDVAPDVCCAKCGSQDTRLTREPPTSAVTNQDALAADVLKVCKTRGWRLDWSARGAYLHLEASELIEAVRGKRGDPRLEAADVLIVLMSITESNGIRWRDVLDAARATVESLRSRPRYAGEEANAPGELAQQVS